MEVAAVLAGRGDDRRFSHPLYVSLLKMHGWKMKTVGEGHTEEKNGLCAGLLPGKKSIFPLPPLLLTKQGGNVPMQATWVKYGSAPWGSLLRFALGCKKAGTAAAILYTSIYVLTEMHVYF